MTASEERILRSTIDDTQIFEVPVRTVKKLLALIDTLREHPILAAADRRIALATPVIECLSPDRDHGPWVSLPTLNLNPPIHGAYCGACGLIRTTQDGAPDRWAPSNFHLPDTPR
jgi:hypothetical protein